MVDFVSTQRVESKTTLGVAFVFKVMTDGVRTRLSLGMAETLLTIRSIQAEKESLDFPRKEDGSPDMDAASPELISKALTLNDRIELLKRSEIDPAYFRACYVAVEGLTVDGLPAEKIDADVMINRGPEELYHEIVDAIRKEAEMSPAERRNLSLPTTSPVPADGQTSAITAGPVASKDSTSTETVASTSQAT